MTTSEPQTKLASQAMLMRFVQGRWWRHAWLFSLAFVREFRTPTILFTVASLLVEGAFHMLLTVKTVDGYTDGHAFMAAMIWSMCFFLIAGISSLIAIFIIVIRAAGFARAYLRFPLAQIPVGPANERYKGQLKSASAEAMREVRSNKKQLVKTWIVCTIIALPAIFVVHASAVIAIGLTPEIVAQFGLSPDVLNLRQGAIYTTIVMLMIISNYSLTTLAVSVMLDRSVKEASIEALILAFTKSPALILTTIFCSVAMTIITTPYVIPLLLNPIKLQAQEVPTLSTYLWQIWQGVSSLILLPAGLAMMLETVRDSVVKPAVLEMTDK